MRFSTNSHPLYCGIDLHARSMYVCIVSQGGEILLHRNMKAAPEPFLKAIAPDRDGLVVAVECIFTWYGLADLYAAQGMPFVLGHALYRKAIHGGTATNEKIDSPKIAVLLRGGMLPKADVSPAEMRATRDGGAERFADPAVHKTLEGDLALIASDDELLRDLNLSILQTATQHEANTL